MTLLITTLPIMTALITLNTGDITYYAIAYNKFYFQMTLLIMTIFITLNTGDITQEVITYT